ACAAVNYGQRPATLQGVNKLIIGTKGHRRKTALDAQLRRRIMAHKRSPLTSIHENQIQTISRLDVLRRGAGNGLIFEPGRSGWAGGGQRGAWSVRRRGA